MSAKAPQISLPQGGGAIRGLGESFQPDIQTGTGNFSIPLELPPGRNSFQPSLTLAYSTGNPNGPFGQGWSLSVPGIRRKTSRGLPRYDATDTFVLSGAEDLVPVAGAVARRQRYRPRIEGQFARIEHVTTDGRDDYWEVRSRDGLRSRYGTPRPAGAPPDWRDPAALTDPANPARVFGWMLSETADPFGNLIRYSYETDTDGHSYTQLLLSEMSYVDYGDPASPSFLVKVSLVYEPRPDPFTDRRAGFAIRTALRCARIETWTQHQSPAVLARTVQLQYSQADGNARSLLTRLQIAGHDGAASEQLPPLEFGYTAFAPQTRRYQNVTAPHGQTPATSLGRPDTELVDLFGNGLPCVLQMNGQVRQWRNLGDGRLDLPRSMSPAPPVALADQGVQLADMTGDGHVDLLISQQPCAGYYPLTFAGAFDPTGFVRYASAPTVNLEDPQVRLIDLDGDGVIDALRTGDSRFELFYNDPKTGWSQTTLAPPGTPPIDFRDPRVKLADITGDGLADLVLVHDRNITYWPYLGYGRWDAPVTIANPPHFEDAAIFGTVGYDPRRVLLGDVDGDGCADLVYVGDGHVTVWINQSGQRFAYPVTVPGTPAIADTDAVRLTDLLGNGTAGILWSYDAGTQRGGNYKFLDLTGGTKPDLLDTIDNRRGARTTVEYQPSTRHYLADQSTGPWRTTLPFPVQVVARTTVVDVFSNTTLTSEYDYHHGYWDGAEREFRGFARVDHRDTLTGGSGEHYSPPTETRTWFHLGPVGPEHGDWHELDLSSEYWTGDEAALGDLAPPVSPGLPRRALRDAVRARRGQVLRTELYALDGDPAREQRPSTVTEHVYGVREESPPGAGESPDRQRVFFPHPVAERTTQWERGRDPLTQASFTGDYDAYGQPRSHSSIAVARGRDYRVPLAAGSPPAPYLATETITRYAQRDDADRYIVDRAAGTTAFEIVNDGTTALAALQAASDAGTVSRHLIDHQRHLYDGSAFEGLPAGQLGDYGALTRTDSLILTDELIHDGYRSGDTVLSPPETPPYLNAGQPPAWSADYPQLFRDQLPANAGYTYQPAGASPPDPAGYYAATERRSHDFQTAPGDWPRGLVTAIRDPLGHDTTITHDEFALLPTDITDPVGLTTPADYDYRVFKPAQVTDPNGNRTAYAYTPLGLLATTAVMGRAGENLGDTPDTPGTQRVYDLAAFDDPAGPQPISVRTIQRVHHVNDLDVPQPDRDQTIEKIEYSDGFGRLLQTRSQAEDITFGDDTFGDAGLPADQTQNGDAIGHQVGTPGQPRVVVSGWQTYDNKGQVVEKYEPFFSAGWGYGQPTDAQRGRKATMFYDPRGHLVRTVNPNRAEQRVIHGVPGKIANPDLTDPDVFEPTPWEAYTYDANDNAGRTHPALAAAYKDHWNTPSSIVVDALGRTISSTERNGQDPTGDWFTTRYSYDIRGNLLTLTDARGRIAFRYVYDLAAKAQTLRVQGIDAGVSRTVRDAAGNVIEQRDSKGALVLHGIDLLLRPSRLWARDDTPSAVTLREQLGYGDGGDPNQPAGERDSNRQLNRLGQLASHRDEAGLLTLGRYDFKGNITDKNRQVIADDAILSVYNPPPPNWQVPAWRIDWQTPAGTLLLDPDRHETTLTFDALNRVVSVLYPQDVDGKRKQLRAQYNRAGALERLDLDNTTFVERIVYNAKGQQVLIAYGNGIMTRYAHHPDTFRLARLRSEPYSTPAPDTYQPSGPPHQDLGYQHDLVGNTLWIHDRAPASGLPITPDVLDRHFTYEPVYRLKSATGREADLPPTPTPWDDTPKPADRTRVRRYTENYRYDQVGNILQLDHNAGSIGSFTRDLRLDPDNSQPHSNRLAALTVSGTTSGYTYDAAGNMTGENTSRHFEWDRDNRMRVYRTQTQGAEPSIHAQYLYDATGHRVKKIVRHNGGTYDTTVYIDGIFELRREATGAATIENNLLHVMDDKQRVATVRVGPPSPPDTTPAVKVHLADHIGSSNVALDSTGALINREEYSPYGETTFGGYAKKRYRFTGMERDEESALAYHGARYYAPWLSRWSSSDPLAPSKPAAVEPYAYCNNNPVAHIDPDGRAPQPDPNTIAKGITVAIQDLLNFFRDEHAATQGTMEAALAEAQGAGVWAGDKGRLFNHLTDLVGAVNRVGNQLTQISEQMSSLAKADPKVASELGNAIRPVIDRARDYMGLGTQVIAQAKELTASYGGRLSQIFRAQGRTAGNLISARLRSRGVDILPARVAAQETVRAMMARIRALPITMEELARSGQALADTVQRNLKAISLGVAGAAQGAGAAARTGARTVVRSAASAARTFFGTAALWFGGIVSFAFVIGPLRLLPYRGSGGSI